MSIHSILDNTKLFPSIKCNTLETTVELITDTINCLTCDASVSLSSALLETDVALIQSSTDGGSNAGALQVQNGGAFIKKDLYVEGNLYAANFAPSAPGTTGSFNLNFQLAASNDYVGTINWYKDDKIVFISCKGMTGDTPMVSSNGPIISQFDFSTYGGPIGPKYQIGGTTFLTVGTTGTLCRYIVDTNSKIYIYKLYSDSFIYNTDLPMSTLASFSGFNFSYNL
jgi:hypothetical protein